MRSILLLLFLVLGFTTSAQTEDELKALAIYQAKIACEATENSDYETLFDYTMPEVLELMGGRQNALTMMRDTMKNMESNGVSITSSEVIEMTGFAFEQDQYRCVIKNKVVVRMSPEQSTQSISHMFGIYNPELNRWYFIEGAQLNNEAVIGMILPDLKTALNIPPDERTMIDN